MTPEAMVAYACKVYAPHGIEICAKPVEAVNLAALADLHVGACWKRTPTADQQTLFGYGNNVPSDELCVYFVRSIVGVRPFAGCSTLAAAATYPNGRAVAVIDSNLATSWTLGHECGHLLGLSDVALDTTRVMFHTPASIAVDPPVLNPGEVVTIEKSPFVRPTTPPPPPGPAPHPPYGG